MTPKEKAEELMQLYTVATWIKTDEIKLLSTIPSAKECALIAIIEILSVLEYGGLWIYSEDDTISDRDFWQEVKSEIEKM